MLERSVPAVLKLFPHGLSGARLLSHLRAAGVRPDPASLLVALRTLSARGEIRFRQGRWTAVRPLPDEGATAPRTRQRLDPPSGGDCLSAVPARVLDRSAPPAAPTDPGEEEAPAPLPWRALLSYYAATQRRDPRGSVAAFPDQHGSLWQLFHGAGRWWEGAELRIAAPALPAPLREALARAGREGAASLGWPILVARDDSGLSCRPALLLPAVWRLEAAELVFAVEPVPPSLNPEWLRALRRRTAWVEEELREALLAGDEAPAFDAIADRMRHALARLGGERLRPAELDRTLRLEEGALANVAAFVLPSDASYTRRVAEDLERIAGWDAATAARTALGCLLCADPGPPGPAAAVAEAADLTDAQFAAADAALSGPLTLIQGPPGTGKSATIVALVCSALAEGRSVLLVTRNHRALDEVERRLRDLLPESPVLVRGRDREGRRDQGFPDALAELVEARPAGPEAVQAAEARRAALLADLRRRSEARRRAAEGERLALELAELADRAEALRRYAPGPVGAGAQAGGGILATLARVLRRLRHRPPGAGGALPEGATLREVEARRAELQRRFAALGPVDLPAPEPVIPRLQAILRARTVPDTATVARLRDLRADLTFRHGAVRLRDLDAETARTILAHRPVWAMTSLSVPARIPLIPALFDLAIFDEASQCDIASALPVLARAARAAVVGDPQQLSFVPGLGREQENALMDAAGLPRRGRARLAQSVNSLYDVLAHRLPPDRVHFLRDQFRSAPAIVDYANAAFYDHRLVACRVEEELAAPSGYRPGLHWQEVAGPCTRENEGYVNRAEADWIAGCVRRLAGEEGFEGKVGVIAPFNAQVGLIRRRIDALVEGAARARLGLEVGTVDRWQGGEADVILFSLVAGRGAPQGAIKFLAGERRRFNVAVSRARAVAIVVGDLAWARCSGIAHVELLAERATRAAPPALERSESLWERRLAEGLRRRGLPFEQQYQVGSRYLDFALFRGPVKLDVEVDGRRWHEGPGGGRKTADRRRDQEMIARGWKVRRFWVHELQDDMEGCLDIIERDLG